MGCLTFQKKEGKASMLIGDIDITRLMMHVQHVEKDKKREKKSIIIRAKTSRNKSQQQKGNGNHLPSKRNKRYLLLHMYQETKVSTIVKIRIISKLDLPILKVALYKGVVSLLYVLSVVGDT